MDLATEVDRLVEKVGRFQRRHGIGGLQRGLGRLLAARWTELGPEAPRVANLGPGTRPSPACPAQALSSAREAGASR